MTLPDGHAATASTSTCPKTHTCVAPTVGVGVADPVDVFVTGGVTVDVAVVDGVTGAVFVPVGVCDGVPEAEGVAEEVGVVDTAETFTHSVPGSSGLYEQSICRFRT